MNKITSVIVLGVLVFPMATFAQGNPDRPNRPFERPAMMEKLPRLKNVCSDLSAWETRTLDTTNRAQEKMETRLGLHIENREQQAENKLGKIDDKQAQWDAKRNAGYEKLETASDTDAERAAVEAFQQAIEDAVAAKRTALATALGTFKSDAAKELTNKQTAIDTAFTAFETAITTAFNAAETACAGASVDEKTVVAELGKSLQSARQTFHTTLRDIMSPKGTVKELSADKKAAIQKAIDDFKASVAEARADLESAMQE